jgi:succinate dehydrogenase / fumarate reductase flavoprotein subunit
MPGLAATDPAGKRREAEQWCDRFAENTRKWLKSTIAKCDADGNPQISYQDIDTSLIRPRPRLYGLVGAEAIEEVWKGREAAADETPAKAAVGAGA